MIFSYSRLSIRHQVVLLALVLALPVAAMLAWLETTELQRVRAAAYTDVRVVADSTAVSLVHILRDHENLLSRIAERPLVRSMDPAHFDPLMDEILQIRPEINNLAVRDLQGHSIYSFRPNASAPEVARTYPWFQEAVRSETFIAGDAFLGRLVGRWVSVLTYPVRNPEGQLAGFVNTPLDLLKLNERVFQHLPANALVTVVDRSGTILLRSTDPQTYIGKPVPANTWLATAGLREGTISAAGLDGVVRLYSFVTIPGTGWRVVAGLPEDSVFADYRKTLGQTVAIGVGVLLFMLVLAWRLGSAIVRPIANLADIASRVADGHTDVRAEPGGPLEVSAVAVQLNHMLDTRRQHEDALLQSEAFSLSILNSVSAEIAVLDRNGVIVTVNAPWQRFAADNGLLPGQAAPLTGVGSNYLQVCEPIDNTPIDPDAAAARAGIQAVLNGSVASFHLEYPCHSPEQQRWFSLSATPLPHDHSGAVISHTDITQRKLALAETEQALLRLTEAQRVGQIGDWEWNTATQAITWSAQVFTIFGRDPALGPPRSIEETVSIYEPASRSLQEEKVALALESGQAQDYELVLVRPDGQRVFVQAMAVPRKDSHGQVIGLYGTVQDITDRKHAQMALQASVKDKEALLKEVHHRVKNNLQIISSLLRLESGRSAQPDTRAVLTDMQGRIYAMALLHESLYSTGTFASVDLGDYLQQMANQAFRTLAPPGAAAVQLELALESVQVGMDQATPCGLLVNELISNCFKHAFPAGQGGTVRVELQASAGPGQARLCVSDTGIGLPADFETRKANSLGLQLVSDLAQQLNGALQVGPGSSFAVVFTLDDLPS